MSKCKKCGTELQPGAKCCSECGTPVKEITSPDRISMKCQQCNGILTMDKEGDILICPYCGSKELIRYSDTVSVEKIKQQTEFKKWEREDYKEEQKKKEQQEHSYKFGAFGVISIICAVLFAICATVQFSEVKNFWNIFAGIICIIGFVALISSILFRRGIIKTDRSYLATILMVAGFLLFIPFFVFNSNSDKYKSNSSSSQSDSVQEFKWPNSKLAKMLPTPKSNYGNISSDSASSLSVYVKKTSNEDFEDYISKCKEKGFTENYNKTERRYEADNSSDYHLEIYYYENNSEMHIRLDAPSKNYIEHTEPTTEKQETEPTTEKPDTQPTTEKSESKTESKAESKTESKADSGVITPSFKEAMDSYEAFFDEYIEFMKKYKNDPTNLDYLTDYADYMAKYTDYIKKLEEIDEDSLSEADLIYYTEVNSRITKKLLEVQY